MNTNRRIAETSCGTKRPRRRLVGRLVAAALGVALAFPSALRADLKWSQEVDGTNPLTVEFPNNTFWLADDFECNQTGPITNVVFWGAWWNDVAPQPWPRPLSFDVQIWSDLPAGESGTGYSMPRDLLWETNMVLASVGPQNYLPEGWYDPATGAYQPNRDQYYYRFSIPIDPALAYVQQGTAMRPVTNWVAIRPSMPMYPQYRLGWKASEDHWNDDAVWSGPVGWMELRYPQGHPDWPASIDLAFEILCGESGTPPPGKDWGDAPEPAYPTLAASDGAWHLIDTNVCLGAHIDAEPDGQPSVAANADDALQPGDPDDEDGVVFTTDLECGESATIKVAASCDGFLQAWIDWNQTDGWEAGEQVFTDESLFAGTNTLTFAVPLAASNGMTFARFRFGTAQGLGVGGGADDGEVEDHQIEVKPEPARDWGDAPDPDYPTLAASDGARHRIVDGVRLGLACDAETNGLASAQADGDDGDGADDEDGVQLWPLLYVGNTVTARVSAACSGYLQAWIDFDGDGLWESAERIAGNLALAAGLNDLVFAVPSDAVADYAFARLRFSTAQGLGVTGDAADGEVEDYRVRLRDEPAGFDYGDAPAPYATLEADGGARHGVFPGWFLGAGVDGEADGQPTADADGDDADAAGDDEDGVLWPQYLIIGFNANIGFVASTNGRLRVWIDWGRDGRWDAADTVAWDYYAQRGTNYFNTTVPGSATPGTDYFARFRFNKDGGLGPTGPADEGEVEDYRIAVMTYDDSLDFGDAPSPYPTRLAQNGARHTRVEGICLGAHSDGEMDGNPSADAQGDDAHKWDNQPPFDDENGVTPVLPLVPGETATFSVAVSTGGYLNVWIDFNRDGDWDDAGERTSDDLPLPAAGTYGVAATVPLDAPADGTTFARFRFCTEPGAAPTGPAPDGEVEDYRVTLYRGWDWGDARAALRTTAATNGPRHAVLAPYWLGTGVDTEPDGQPSAACDGDDLDTGAANPLPNHDDENGVRWLTPLRPDCEAAVEVVAATNGILSLWLVPRAAYSNDWLWVVREQGLARGRNVVRFEVSELADNSNSAARLRFAPAGTSLADPTGAVLGGEVEDYARSIRGAYAGDRDWGDAPFEPYPFGPPYYPTRADQSGANHKIVDGFCLGHHVDPEPDGLPDEWCGGDDWGDETEDRAEFDDEDGVVLLSPLFPGRTAYVGVYVTMDEEGTGYVHGWFDFDRDGGWSVNAYNENPIRNVAVEPGWNVVSFEMPAGVTAGPCYARFRLTFDTFDHLTLGCTGSENGGEVEDYRFWVEEVPATSGTDYGDAPTNYLAVAGPNAGRHTLATGRWMGGCVDPEESAQGSGYATGDDGHGADDEDLTFLTTLVMGRTAFADVFCGPEGGQLDGWIDVDGDFEWEPHEHVFGGTSYTLEDGLNLNVPIQVPPPPGRAGYTYARFRLSPNGIGTPYGLVDGGEVEDYYVQILQAAPATRPEIVAVEPPTGQNHVTLEWTGDSNATYAVELSSNVPGPWGRLSGRHAGAAAYTADAPLPTPPANTNQCFYRIALPDAE